MKIELLNHMYIFMTVVFTVYGQMVLKWQVSRYGTLPSSFMPALIFILKLFANAWVLSCFLSAFLASLCWMAAMTKFEISYAYPFMSLSFIVVMVLSIFLLSEPLSWSKALGTIIVICGLVVLSR